MTDMSLPTPPFGGLVKLQKDGWEGVPDGPNPFYVGAMDGLYVHKRMLIGRGLARVDSWPTSFPKVNGKGIGLFEFEADPIPAKLMGQVVDFFERIYDRQHTEAAVLLTMHAETKEWRVFVPTQLVSHGGVNYVFEPTDIKWPWVLVGSIHSHCDFGAGHSSTDTGDADGFDGIHMTTGYIKRDVPQIVAMVAMNKRLFHYKPEDFPSLFDFSEAKQHKAPEWWDRYVEDTRNKVRPIGFELYEKYQKSTVVKGETKVTQLPTSKPASGYQPTGYNANDWYFHKDLNRMVHKSWVINDDLSISYPLNAPVKGQNGLTTITTEKGAKLRRIGDDLRPQSNSGYQQSRGSEDYIPGLGYPSAPRHTIYGDDDFDAFYRLLGIEETPTDYKGIDPSDLIEAGYTWDGDDKTWHWTGGGERPKTLAELAEHAILNESKEFNARQAAERGADWDKDGALIRPANQTELERLGIIQPDEYWEDMLGDGALVGALVSSNLVTEDDLDYAAMHPKEAGTTEFWQHLMMRKALTACETLQMMNVNAQVRVRMGPPADIDAELLPEDKPKALIVMPDGTEHPIQQPGV